MAALPNPYTSMIFDTFPLSFVDLMEHSSQSQQPAKGIGLPPSSTLGLIERMQSFSPDRHTITHTHTHAQSFRLYVCFCGVCYSFSFWLSTLHFGLLVRFHAVCRHFGYGIAMSSQSRIFDLTEIQSFCRSKNRI